MKAFKVFLVVSMLFFMAGVNQANGQRVEQWEDYPWFGGFGFITPDEELLVIWGTIYQDFVIHLDKQGNWTKINYQLDKSFLESNTGEVFTAYGAGVQGYTTPDCWNEVIQFRGDRGTMITLRTHIRFHDGKLIRWVESYRFH